MNELCMKYIHFWKAYGISNKKKQCCHLPVSMGARIGLLVVAILQGIQLRLLRNKASLSAHSGLGRLDMYSQDMLSQGLKGKRQLVTFCHMLAQEIPSQFRDDIHVDADAFGGV